MAAERKRLKEDKLRSKNWKRWGSYLAERQWSTVREDYSADGNCWDYFPHDHARSRVYRWGEDGLMGITDRQCRLCFALALWNEKDPILKERLFGVTGSQGNHGEDVKELYYYLDNLPTHSYMKMLYKYPQKAYPYSNLIDENGYRSVYQPEYEVLDTGVFDNNKYWDVLAEYCKASPSDILGRFTISNRGATPEIIHFLPTLWFRNVWEFGEDSDAWIPKKPSLKLEKPGRVRCEHCTMGTFYFDIDKGPSKLIPDIIFTENETNYKRIFNSENKSKYVKDAFHNYVIHRDKGAVNESKCGTKCAGYYAVRVGAGEEVTFKMRLCHQNEATDTPFTEERFDNVFLTRIREADAFYDEVIPSRSPVVQNVARQAYAGLLFSKQFYYYIVKEWLRGDTGHPPPPACRLTGRNSEWMHLFNRDIIAMPDNWDYFPHDHARSRVYRWGEDGLMGITDRQCRLCFALALWNEKDPILKERLFGVTGSQGNHGEDVKELYYYLDNLPTHSYMKMLYKYPQKAYPYSNLIDENGYRSVYQPEYEVLDTGVFDNNKYWDVLAEYCKASPSDILGRFTISNRGATPEIIHFLPTLWFRNVWEFGEDSDAWIPKKPSLKLEKPGRVRCEHCTMGTFYFDIDKGPSKLIPDIIFTENETNYKRIFNSENKSKYVKDAFHNYVIHRDKGAVNESKCGTKCAGYYAVRVGAGEEVTFKMRLCHQNEATDTPFTEERFDNVFLTRIREADAFYDEVIPSRSPVVQNVARQAYAGLLFSKQFYYYIVKEWLRGDTGHPPPPACRLTGRNSEWMHLFNRDIIAMPDKWEYPWYASWDLAFHAIAFANIDINFAKEQLVLFLREWYMHPNGQIPAYEFAFDDVNPPVHAYAVLRVYKKTGPKGQRDLAFLARCFHKLVLNFTWWVNRKDPSGKNIFTGGFLGLDNIGVFDRSKPLPTGGVLAQADATAWMGFFSIIMLQISLILAQRDPVYDDMASKFFEHFISIVDAMNASSDGRGLWNEEDGFYYDHIHTRDETVPLRVRSMVGLVPLFICFVLDEAIMKRHPGFSKRTKWFLDHRKDLMSQISFMVRGDREETLMLSMVTKERIERMMKYILDEEEFLAPYGIRSLSKYHKDHPFTFSAHCESFHVNYEPGESTTNMFGGNSNWRGPIWLCMNYILIETLERYDYFFGETLKVECPTRSGRWMRLRDVARELSDRISRLFLPDIYGNRACHGDEERYSKNPHFKNLVLFYEYFHGETGKGLGASHQTGWTALIVEFLKIAENSEKLFESSNSLLNVSDSS